MQNSDGDLVDIYLPRKWFVLSPWCCEIVHVRGTDVSNPIPFFPETLYSSATFNVLGAKDHASIQIQVAGVDDDGTATSDRSTFAFCGQVRSMGESDDSLNRLCEEAGIVSKVFEKA